MQDTANKKHGLLLTYLGCFLFSLPAAALAGYLGWMAAEALSEGFDMSGSDPAETLAAILLAFMGLFLTIGIYYLLTALLSPIGVYVFLRNYPEHRKRVALWSSLLLLLAPIPAVIVLLIDISFVGYGFAVTIFWGALAPYFAWKLSTRNTAQYNNAKVGLS